MKQTFEQFLEDKFYEEYEGTKDDAENGLDAWISELDVQEVINLAEEWGNPDTSEDVVEDLKEVADPLIAEMNTYLPSSLKI